MQKLPEKFVKFPFDFVAPDSRVVIYGAGKVGVKICTQALALRYCEPIAFVDKNAEIVKTAVGLPVFPLQKIPELEFDYIVVSVLNLQRAIADDLIECGVPPKKIVRMDEQILAEYTMGYSLLRPDKEPLEHFFASGLARKPVGEFLKRRLPRQ